MRTDVGGVLECVSGWLGGGIGMAGMEWRKARNTGVRVCVCVCVLACVCVCVLACE